MRHLSIVPALLALAACGLNGTDRDQDDQADATAETRNTSDSEADEMASRDGQEDRSALPDSEDRPIMQAQVVLDRQGFGPGVVDGKMGLSTRNAIEGWQEARGLEMTGELDEATKASLEEWKNVPATRVVTIPRAWGQADYTTIPDDPETQAEMERLGYNSIDERLAERFHTTLEVLKQLNPDGRPATSERAGADASASPSRSDSARTATASASPSASASSSGKDAGETSFFRAGQQIRVPNIGADRIEPGKIEDIAWKDTLRNLGVGSDQPDVAKVVVSKSAGTLKAYDEQDKLIALFTVTTGSENDPLPLGEWDILGVAKNPPFSYDPDLFWDVPDSDADLEMPPGPNGPVGVVWIDLSKEHYGIHGTPEPQTIGRTQSHGCVRLTNWDAARLSEMVSQKTRVLFEA